MSINKYYLWTTIGESVIGSSHKRNNLPNQDNIYFTPRNEGNWHIAAVSDGHGSKKSFRSDEGSKIAVKLLKKKLMGFLQKMDYEISLSLIKGTLEEKLPQQIVKLWESDVLKHLEKYPFTEKELEGLSEKELEIINNKPSIAYGATLLSVLITERFIVYLQLGDGDILAVTEDGDVFRPIPKDVRHIANETSSLCSDKAWNEVRVHFQTIADNPPASILMCTDGYSNSFVSDSEFMQAGKDFLEIIKTDGINFIESNLRSWLKETSEKGSGDDTTLAIISRL